MNTETLEYMCKDYKVEIPLDTEYSDEEQKHKTFEDFDNFLFYELFAKQHDELCDQHARAHYYNFPEEHPGHLNGLRNI